MKICLIYCLCLPIECNLEVLFFSCKVTCNLIRVVAVIKVKTSVIDAWSCLFSSQKLYLCCKFSICLHGNVSSILWEYVEQFELNIMNIGRKHGQVDNSCSL